MTARRKGEQEAAPPPAGSFGTADDESFETPAPSPRPMGSETDVEEPATGPDAGDTPGDTPGHTSGDTSGDTSGGTATTEEEPGGEAETGSGSAPDGVLEDETERTPVEPDVAQLELALAERTADLQRLQAEYVNYKRRVDRDRELVRENATFAALAPIVEVLDTIDRAREHGELEAGFAAVADQLERAVSGAGLVKYGRPGDAFDPRLHEALSHIGEDPEVEVTTCKVIAKAGYRIGERVVRAAQVLVVDPANA